MTSPITMILMATDFGSEAEVALRACVSLARQLNASIHLLHVTGDPTRALHEPEVSGIDWDAVRADIAKYARESLAALAAAHPDVPIATEVLVGSPAETIARRAAEIGATLVVVGTHGRGGFDHLLMGSVAERVIRLAPCPVMTVRASGAARVEAREAAAAAVPHGAH